MLQRYGFAYAAQRPARAAGAGRRRRERGPPRAAAGPGDERQGGDRLLRAAAGVERLRPRPRSTSRGARDGWVDDRRTPSTAASLEVGTRAAAVRRHRRRSDAARTSATSCSPASAPAPSRSASSSPSSPSPAAPSSATWRCRRCARSRPPTHAILETGRFDARVATRGTRDPLDRLGAQHQRRCWPASSASSAACAKRSTTSRTICARR